MANYLTNTGEGTQGATVTNANSGGPNQFTAVSTSGVGTAVIYDNAHVHSGTTAIKVTLPAGVAATAQQDWSGAGLNPTPIANAYLRFYVYMTAYPTVNAILCKVIGTAAVRGSLQVTTTGTIRTVNQAGGTPSTSTAVIPLNAWCRIEFETVNNTGTAVDINARMYSGANLETNTPDTGGVLASQANAESTNSLADTIRFGPSSSVTETSAWSIWYDDLAFSDSYPLGPLGQPVPPVGGVATTWHPGRGPGQRTPRFSTSPRGSNIISTIDATAVAALIDCQTSLPTPTIAVGSTVTASVVACAATIPTPVVSTGQTVVASAIAATTSMPTPAVATGETANPGVIACSTTIPIPVVTNDTTATATAIAATVTIPTPTIGTGTGLHRNFAEGQSSGTTLTAANSGAGYGDTAFDLVSKTGTATVTYDNAQQMHGLQSYHVVVTTVTDTVDIRWSTSINSPGSACRVYIRFSSLPGIAQDLISFRNSAGGTTAKIQLTAANKFAVANSAGAGLATFASTLLVAVWYRVELEAAPGTTTSNGTINARYFLGDSTTAQDTPYVSTGADNAGTTNITSFRFGKLSTTVGTLDAWFEDIAFNDSTISPLGPTVLNAAITATALATTTTIPAPVVSVGSAVTGSAITATTTVLTPSVASSETVTATAVSCATTIPTPVVGVDVSITSTVINATTTIATPSVSTPAPATQGTVTTAHHPGRGPSNARFIQRVQSTYVAPRDFLIVVADMQPGAAVNPPPSVVAAAVVADNPDMVLMPGDLANDGTTAQYGFLNTMYGSIKSKLFPTPGNHDWTPGNLTQYDTYWGAQAHSPDHYYSFDSPTTGWHIIALESDTGTAHDAASAQYTWLQADLAANAGKPMIAFWHHPRYSDGNSCGTPPCNGVGTTGDDRSTQPFWDLLHDAGCDLVFVGHCHSYQRFPKWSRGTATTVTPAADPKGIREFVVGTGGSGLHTGVPTRNEAGSSNSLQTSAYDQLNSQWFGYLRLYLTPTTYSWEFVSQNAGVLDSGGPVTINNVPIQMPAPLVIECSTDMPDAVAKTGSTASASAVLCTTSVPTPVITSAANATAGVISATTTLTAPVAHSSVVATATVISAITTLPTAVVATGATTTPTVVATTTTLPVPTVTSSAATSAVVIPATTSFGVTVVHTGETVTATTITATTVLPTPSVSSGGSATINALVIAVTAAVPVPTISTGATATATVLNATTVLTTPAASASTQVTAVALATTTNVPVPVVKSGSTANAIALQVTTTLPAPTVNVPARPSALSLITTIAQPTVGASSNVNVNANSIISTTMLGTPSASSGATSIGTAVAGFVVMSTPMVVAGSATQPQTITTSVLIPVPGVNLYMHLTKLRIRVVGREGPTHVTGSEPTTHAVGREGKHVVTGQEPGS